MLNSTISFTNLQNELLFNFTGGTGSTGATGATGPTGPTGFTGPTGAGSSVWLPNTLGSNYGATTEAQTYNFWGLNSPASLVGQSAITGISNSSSGNPLTAGSNQSILMENNVNRDANNSLVESIVSVNDIGTMNGNSFNQSIFASTGQPSMNTQSFSSTTALGRGPANGQSVQESTILCSPNSRYQFIGAPATNRSCILIQSNRNAVSSDFTNAQGSCVISNQQSAIAVNANRQFICSDFSNYFLRFLAVGGSSLVTYDPGTGQVFNSGVSIASLTPNPMAPTSRGIGYGFTPDTDIAVSLGYSTLRTYSSNPQNSQVQVIGTNSLFDIDASSVPFINNTVIGGDVLTNIGGIGEMTGNIILGSHGLTANAIGRFNRNILISGSDGDLAYANLNGFGRAEENICLTTGQCVYDEEMNIGSICINNQLVERFANNCICLSTGGTVNNGSRQGNIIMNVNPSSSIVMGGFANCLCVNNSVQTSSPIEDTQAVFSHQSMRFEFMQNNLPNDANDQLLYIDPQGKISKVDTSTSIMRRLFVARGTTNASGDVVINYGSLGLTFNPHVTATVVQNSLTIFHGVKALSVTNTTATFRVFNSVNVVLASPSMVPAGAGIQIDVHIAY